jgi:hypothetical protein
MQKLRSLTLPGLAFGLLAPVLSATDILVIDPGGTGDFTSIQAGVLAAQDGDHLLVREGSYAAVEIAGKGVSIDAEPGALVVVRGGVRVIDTQQVQGVHLAGLELRGSYAEPGGSEHALVAETVRGPLRVQDCTLRAAQGQQYTRTNDHGGDGANLVDARNAAFVRCDLTAGDGGGNFDGAAFLQRSGHGLWSTHSSIVLQDCDLIAGDSMEFDIFTCDYGGQQGHGAYVLDGTIFASGTRMEGGLGGTEGLCAQIFPGGDGLRVDGAATGVVLDCELIGGPDNVCNAGAGQPSNAVGGATIREILGTSRSLAIPSPSVTGESATLEVRGEPGDLAWLLLSFEPGYRDLTAALSGPLLVGTPLASPRRRLGYVSESGRLLFPVVAPAVPMGNELLELHAQLLVRDEAGAVLLAGAQRWSVLAAGL